VSNLADLRSEVRERIGETSEADFFTDAEIDRALNEGLKRFSNEERWPWLFADYSATMQTGVDELDLPDNIAINRIFALSIMDTNVVNGGVMIERVTPMEGFRLRHQYRNSTNVPRWYYITRTNLADDGEPPIRYTAKLIPTPSADYDVSGIYMAVPLLLDGSSNSPMMPEEYQAALPAYAAGLLFLKELEVSQKASEQFAIYNSILQNALKETKRFDEDEIVAWGRSKPSGRRGFGLEGGSDMFWGRVAPTLGQ
jgi:hypothetical protein